MPRLPDYDPAEDPRWHGLHLLGHGYSRLCALDPGDPRHCLKFELPAEGRSRAGGLRHLHRVLAGYWLRFGDNALELRAWHYLARHLGEEAPLRFAASDGIVETAWGRALRCRRVVLDNGRTARNLHSHLVAGSRYPADALCAAVDEFAAFLQRRRIPLFDLNPGNFVVVPGPAGQPRLVCVDAKSVLAGKEFLPLSRRIPFLLQRKIARRAARLHQHIQAAPAHPPTLAPSLPGH